MTEVELLGTVSVCMKTNTLPMFFRTLSTRRDNLLIQCAQRGPAEEIIHHRIKSDRQYRVDGLKFQQHISNVILFRKCFQNMLITGCFLGPQLV